MVNTEDVSEFNALVAECAGSPVRGNQESYLIRVVNKVMKDRYVNGKKDFNSVFETITPAQEDMRTACLILDAFYSEVAKVLLNDLSFDVLDIRTRVIREMQKTLDGVQ